MWSAVWYSEPSVLEVNHVFRKGRIHSVCPPKKKTLSISMNHFPPPKSCVASSHCPVHPLGKDIRMARSCCKLQVPESPVAQNDQIVCPEVGFVPPFCWGRQLLLETEDVTKSHEGCVDSAGISPSKERYNHIYIYIYGKPGGGIYQGWKTLTHDRNSDPSVFFFGGGVTSR